MYFLGPGSDEFTVEVRHGGFFVGQGHLRSYVDGKVSWFDFCDADTWSPLWFDDFIEQLNYERTESMKIYWLLPGMDIADGLRVIKIDSDTNAMVAIVDRIKNLMVYFDHDDNISDLNFDDIIVNPIAELPKVLSPRKEFGTKKLNEHVPTFCNEVPKVFNLQKEFVDNSDSDSDGSSEDSVFVDSDYEIEAEDDDLFVDNVDVEVVDEGIAKGLKFGNRASNKMRRSAVAEGQDDLATDEECLDLPYSDDEGEVRLRFKSFMPEDLNNPVFKVGMVFPSVEVLRKAITEYSLKNRVQIKMPRNDRTRIEAICAAGCPWEMYASNDNRAKGFLVKTYQGEHNCQKEWVLQR